VARAASLEDIAEALFSILCWPVDHRLASCSCIECIEEIAVHNRLRRRIAGTSLLLSVTSMFECSLKHHPQAFAERWKIRSQTYLW
jgi:hypothetical protein